MNTNTNTNGQQYRHPGGMQVKYSQLLCYPAVWGVDCSERVVTTDGNVYRCPSYWMHKVGNTDLRGCSLEGRESQQDKK